MVQVDAGAGAGSGSGGAGSGGGSGCAVGGVSCGSLRRRGAAASGCGRSRRWRRSRRGRGCSSGKVSVVCSGMLDSGRSVNTESGSPGVPGVAGSVIAWLMLALLVGGGGLAGRTAW